MKKRLLSLFVALTMVMSLVVIVPAATVSAADDSGGIIAFPGAEGAGKYATGGRGGKIYHVTNLNDSGTGSFRDAVSGSNRIVVFDIGGTITLKSDVVVKSNVTILGQTAPGGGGITLSGYKLGQGGSNQIIRFVSSRPGERGSGEYDAWGGNNGSNSIVDHCSIGWANDEQWGLYSNNTNQTVQYSIIGPSNCISTHAKGAHGFGIMFGSYNVSWHHNMIAHNISRNFRGKVGSGYPADFVNNVIYDWGYQTAYGTLGHLNYVGNYLKAGQSTRGSYHLFVRSSGTGYENFKFYVTGNKLQKKDGSDYNSSYNSDNWNMVGFDKSAYGSDTPFAVYDVNGNDASVASTAESADEAYEHVLAYAGAGINSESRPQIDQEVMEEARTGTGYLTGGRDFSEADSSQKTAISKYNIQHVDYDTYYPETVQKTITDSDSDGMPDDWEVARGLDPNNASDASGDYLGQGYMNIEYYANDLTVDAFPEGVVETSPETADLGPEYTAAKEDLAALSISPTTIKTADQLTLPQTGSVNGTAITWASSSSAIKIKDNQISSVKRSDNDKTVTLTASVEASGYTLKKTFTVTVLGSSLTWTASADVTSGQELFDGLTAGFDGTYKASEITNSGTSFAGYLTGSSNGNLSDGVGTGTYFKLVAPENGYVTVYVTNLGAAVSDEKPEGNPKTLYITPEGASSGDEAVASITGLGISTSCTAAVEAGKTYYIYVAGSKGRFNGIKFSLNEPEEVVKATPIRWNFSDYPFIVDGIPNSASFPEGGEEGRYVLETDAITPENFSGLKFTVSDNIDNSYTKSSKTYDDGLTTSWELKTGSGEGSESNKVFSFTPAEDGTVTVYARSGSSSSSSTLTINQGGSTTSMELPIFSEQTDPLPTLSMKITADTEVKVYASSNTGYAAIGYYNENYVEPTPSPEPTATPEPTAKPPLDESSAISWNFSDEPFVKDGAANTDLFPSGTHTDSSGNVDRYNITSSSIKDVNGLTFVTSATLENQFQGSSQTVGDETFKWSLKTAGASSDGDKVFTYTPEKAGAIRVYAKSGSGSADSGITVKQGGKTIGSATYTTGAAVQMDEFEVAASSQVTIESTGNTQYYKLAFVPFGESTPDTTATPEPSATSEPLDKVTATVTENTNGSYTVNVTGGYNADGVLICSVYDTDGTLTYFDHKNVSDGTTFDLSPSDFESGSTVKIYSWDSLTGMNPAAESYTGTIGSSGIAVVSADINTFAMNLNGQMNKNENYMVSPFSAKMALAMAANGANGETKTQILQALCIDGLDEYNEQAKGFMEDYTETDFDFEIYNALVKKYNKYKKYGTDEYALTEEEMTQFNEMRSRVEDAEKPFLSIANSIWINKDAENCSDPAFSTEYADKISTYYGGTSGVVDSSNAADTINKWTSDKTCGKISQILDDSDTDFLFALLNAVYFNGKWMYKFETATETADFTNADSTVSSAEFMNLTKNLKYYKDEDLAMVRLPYKGNEMSMYVSIDDGSIESYDGYFDMMETKYVHVKMPKFTFEYTIEDFNSILMTLGMKSAFSSGLADFDGMCTGVPNGTYIQKVAQKTYIDVDQTGTEAAAVTTISGAAGATAPTPEPELIEFTADKPFTFIIRDDIRGEILFIGRLASK